MSETILKVAIFIHSSLDTQEGTMRVYNAIEAAKEFKDAGDYIDIVFDGAGTRTAVLLNDPSNPLYERFKGIEDVVTGICRYCIGAFSMENEAQRAGLSLLDDFHSHPSYRNYIVSGYKVLNF